MLTLLKRIKNKIHPPKEVLLTQALISQASQILAQHHIASIPSDYLHFLHFCNGLQYQDAWLLGIFEEHTQINDICRFNLQISHPLSKDIIFLGFDEFDLLGYNQKWNGYQIIDKDDFEVLEEYQDLETALNYILKIES